ncbi:MAG: DNA polymerase Y family protein [Pseudomonadota bacterium]
MRIACLHLPGFVVQAHARAAPHLKSVVFAVLDETEKRIPQIIACSRKARDGGVKIGMTATQARAAAPTIQLLKANKPAYQDTMRALGEHLLTLSPTVDIQQQGVVYLRVPPGSSGSSFGRLILETAALQGLVGRVGIADDKFTAWAATQISPKTSVKLVPPGRSARFLAPIDLGLLPLDSEVARTLQLLGVHTLGDFAALPPPSVGRRWAREGIDLQTLARGADPTPLHPFTPTSKISEHGELEGEVTELQPLLFVVRPLLERAVKRLRGRGQAAAKVVVVLTGAAASEKSEITLAPGASTASWQTFLDLLRVHLSERQLAHPVLSASVSVVEEAVLEEKTLDLLDRLMPSAEVLDGTVTRLRAAFGEGAAFGARLVDSYRPEGAFEKVPFVARAPQRQASRRTGTEGNDSLPRVIPALVSSAFVLRLLEPPCEIRVDCNEEERNEGVKPQAIHLGDACCRIVAFRGPTRLEGEWWTDSPFRRDYYEIETEDGARYWLYRDRSDGKFYLHGVFD